MSKTCKDCKTTNPEHLEYCQHCGGKLYRSHRKLQHKYQPFSQYLSKAVSK